jgi:3-methyladenine DNA glycosylase Mpg
LIYRPGSARIQSVITLLLDLLRLLPFLVAVADDLDLARGPGRLCAALGLDRRLDGIDLCRDGPLCLGDDAQVSGEIGQSRRIGITRAADSVLRFYVRGNCFVSGPRTLNR